MKSVGIDIGTSSIKVVEVTASKRGIKVSRFTEHVLGQNPAFDPELEIVEFIRSLAAAYDPATTRFCIGLRQEVVSSRFWSIPFSDRNKILKLLPNELEEELPFSSDSAIYDFKTIRTQGAGSDMLVAATPKHRIETLMSVLKSANIEPALVSAEGIALANCYEKWDGPPPVIEESLEGIKAEATLTLQIHMGHSRTLVLAYDRQRLVTVRTIFWGGKNVAEAIARKYELPYIEAIKEMQNKAFLILTKEGSSYDQIVFSETIANQVKDLARDLSITILELKAQFNATIGEVLISGGASSILNMNAFLTQQLDVPVNRMQTLDNFPGLGFEKNPKVEAVVGVALGMALEGLKRPRNPAINFLRGEFAPQNLGLQIFFTKWGPSLRVAAGFFVIFFIYSIQRQSITFNLTDQTDSDLKAQAIAVAKLDRKQATEKGIARYIEEQKKRSTDAKNISKVQKMNSALDIFKKITEATPSKNSVQVEVRKFHIEEDVVHIEGLVATSQQLSLLQTALASAAMDNKVTTLKANLPVPAGSTAFAFELKVDRGVK